MPKNTIKIIIALLSINLVISIASAQSISGSIGVNCPTGASQPSMTINDGITTPATLDFELASGNGILDDPMKNGTQFKLNIIDARGYDSGPGTCGNGFDIVLQADTANQYFVSLSGNNNSILAIGNGPNNCMTIQGTDWDTNPSDVGLLSVASGSEFSGVSETNIHGAPQTELDYVGNNLTALLATVDESFEGELQIVFEGDDLNLDIPSGIPVDKYFKSMVLSLS